MVLNSLTPELTVIEPDSGSFTSMQVCFVTNLDLAQPLGRFAVFEFIPTDMATAEIGSDFFVDIATEFLFFPPNATGFQVRCINVTVIGDDLFEEDEVVDYQLLPLSELDSVTYVSGNSVRLNIINNDGKVGPMPTFYVTSCGGGGGGEEGNTQAY